MAIYHNTLSTGGKVSGKSAEEAVRYICKVGKYKKAGDVVVAVESGHMPSWATKGKVSWTRSAGLQLWRSADTHERKNGRLFKSLEFALPNELTVAANHDLARRYMVALTAGIDGGDLPFTFAVHARIDASTGKLTNYHVHGKISERVNDGIERSPELWFRRAASSPKAGAIVDPALGGARKTYALRPEEWLLDSRRRWADMANDALAAAGLEIRIDHRTLEEQGLVHLPEPKLGPKAAAIERLGGAPTLNGERMRASRALNAALAAARAAADEASALEAAAAAEAVEADERLDRALKLHQAQVRARGRQAAVQPARPEVAAFWEAERRRLQLRRYAKESEELARYWKDRKEPDGTIVYENKMGRVVDTGSRIEARTGNDLEISAMIQLASLKDWRSIVFTGTEEFKRRAMLAALKNGVGVLAGAGDEQLLSEAHIEHRRRLAAQQATGVMPASATANPALSKIEMSAHESATIPKPRVKSR